MHPKNAHQGEYKLKSLSLVHPELATYLITTPKGTQSIDFSNPKAVYALNKALLYDTYNIKNWDLPQDNLCPPIPGRADYIHYLADLIPKGKNILGLDVGTGANAIYPLLAQAIYGWDMVGCDSNTSAIISATANTKDFAPAISIRLQENNSQLLKGIIQDNEYYDFTMCNPPFYASKAEAVKASASKHARLNIKVQQRNFSGLDNELWCNGGEALFIKRLVKESVLFKKQVGWFSCLLSQKQNLPKVTKQLDKLKATYRIIEMEQGNKKSRFIAWKFTS